MQVIQSLEFKAWLKGLRDVVGRRAILKRLARLAATDNFGDAAPVGDGVFEMRFHIGPGYRVYFMMRDGAVILCGGDKGSQGRDIAKAKEIAADYKD